MKKIILIVFAIILFSISQVFSQSTAPITTLYPKTVGYFSFIVPIVTINKDKTTNDFSSFKNGFAIGFPVGVNILYSVTFGFSYEITPTIQTGSGSSKTSKILFDPAQCSGSNMDLQLYPGLHLKLQGDMALHLFLIK